MAKTITDEQIKLSIIINGDNSKKELIDLEKNVRKLNESNKELRLQQQRLKAQGKENTAEYKNLTAEIKKNSLEINSNKSRMEVLRKEIGLSGLTISQLRNEATRLRMVLNNLTPGSEDFVRYRAQLNAVNAQLGELTGRAKAASFTLGNIADGFNRYAALGASVIATLTGVVLSIQKIIDFNSKLSDAQADVMKTTRMTKEEVDELTKSFGLFQTRTQRIDLLNIAKVGGELNIAKEEIADFVRVMDKAGVALGDSFEGGAEEVATKLGKIKTLYDDLKGAKVETAFEAVGSALNDLGADGNATASNVADFVTRIGTIPGALQPSIEEALGLGAAFEESGLRAEIAGTNYAKVINIAARDFPEFAKVMKKSKEEVQALLNTNPTEFFLQFAESLKGLNATQVASLLDKLKLNDNEVRMVLGAASKNTDLFRQKIDLANASMQEATSLTEEFNVKNNNLAALLEKIGKKINSWFTSEGFNNWLFNMVEGFGKLIGATDDADGAGKKWRQTLFFTAKVIAVLTSALITNVAWQKLVALWTARNTSGNLLYTVGLKARLFVENLSILSSQAFAAAQMLLTGNVRGATQAFRVFTATLMTTPWGFILGALAAITTAYVAFSDEAEEVATAQTNLAKINSEVKASLEKETVSLFALLKVAKDEKASKEARIKAIKELNKISPEHLGNLSIENIKTMEAKSAIDQYIKSLETKIKLQIFQQKIKKQMEEMDEKRNQSLEDEIDFLDKAAISVKNFFNTIPGAEDKKDEFLLASKRREAALDVLQKKLDLTREQMNEFLKANPDAIDDKTGGGGGNDDGNPKANNPNDSQAEINRLKLDKARELSEALKKIQEEQEEARIAAMQEGYEKELAIENQRYKREIEDLERLKVSGEMMLKIEEDILKASEDKNTTRLKALQGIRQEWLNKNVQIQSQIDNIKENKEKIHLLKIATIQEKAANDYINDLKENFENQKVVKETIHLEELAALGNNEAEKEKLRQKFAQEQIDDETAYLQELLLEFEKIIQDNQAGGINLDLLTPEQVGEFEKLAAKVGLALAELNNKKGALQNQSDREATLQAQANRTALGLNNTDILGFTQENWMTFFENIKAGKFSIDEMAFAVQALTNVWAQYGAFVQANEARQFRDFEIKSDKRKQKLKRQLDAGVISQTFYNRQIERIDTELDRKRADMEYKAAKRQRMLNIANAISGVALAVINALQTKPFVPTGIAMASIAGVMGALQIGTILRTPITRGFEEGLYPEVIRQQDGKRFKNVPVSPMRSGLYRSKTILVGEASGSDPEMVIDARTYKRINPELRQALENEIIKVKGFEKGFYNTQTNRFEVPSQTNDEMLTMIKMLTVSVNKNIELLEEMKNKPFQAVVSNRDYRSMKNIEEGVEKFKQIKDKSKK